MQTPIDTIEHDGEQFRISYNEWFRCSESEESWEVTTPNDLDETYRTEPKQSPDRSRCGENEDIQYVKRVHYYTKFAIKLEDPPLEVEPHAEALRQKARELEALKANGYEITQSDGVHIYLEKIEKESLDSNYEITDDLS